MKNALTVALCFIAFVGGLGSGRERGCEQLQREGMATERTASMPRRLSWGAAIATNVLRNEL